VIAVIEQAAVIRQILEHLDIAVPAHANRRPPVQRPPYLGGALRNERGVAEAPEWTDDSRDADHPLVDPLTI
jgi:hypothetical protein